LRALTLHRLQVATHHSDFDGLQIDIDAEKVMAQDFGLAIDGEALRAVGIGVDFAHEIGRRMGVAHFLFRVRQIPLHVVVDQVLERAGKERPGAAGGIEDTDLLDLFG